MLPRSRDETCRVARGQTGSCALDPSCARFNGQAAPTRLCKAVWRAFPSGGSGALISQDRTARGGHKGTKILLRAIRGHAVAPRQRQCRQSVVAPRAMHAHRVAGKRRRAEQIPSARHAAGHTHQRVSQHRAPKLAHRARPPGSEAARRPRVWNSLRWFHHHDLSIAADGPLVAERLEADKPVGAKKLHRAPSAGPSRELDPPRQPRKALKKRRHQTHHRSRESCVAPTSVYITHWWRVPN